MSIRTLTDRLHEEFVEARRTRHFDAVRSRSHSERPESTQPSDRRTAQPDRAAAANPNPEASSPRVGLRERPRENPWGIPGGIANRFGRGALAQSVAKIQTEQHPEAETTQAKAPLEAETDRPAEDASERDTEQNEAARITIELQSH